MHLRRAQPCRAASVPPRSLTHARSLSRSACRLARIPPRAGLASHHLPEGFCILCIASAPTTAPCPGRYLALTTGATPQHAPARSHQLRSGRGLLWWMPGHRQRRRHARSPSRDFGARSPPEPLHTPQSLVVSLTLWLSCSQRILPEPSPGFVEALAQLDTDAVKADIRALLTSSEDFWPADYGQRRPRLRRQCLTACLKR